MVDASLSIDENEWELELKFAIDTVEAFAKRGIFENGGTASYVQFAASATNEGTFNSTESFNAHIPSDYQGRYGTDIVDGTQSPASAYYSFEGHSVHDLEHACLCHPPHSQAFAVLDCTLLSSRCLNLKCLSHQLP